MSKTLSIELNDVTNQCVEIVNPIKSNALNSRVFKNLCNDMESSHESLLLQNLLKNF
jgi:hypothetical protein